MATAFQSHAPMLRRLTNGEDRNMKTTMLRGVSIVAVLVVVGGAGAWLVAGQGGKARTRPIGSETAVSSSVEATRSNGDESAALRRRLSELELKVGVLSAQAAARPSDEPAKAQDAPQESEPQSFEEQVKHDRAAWEDHIAEVALNFEAEARDGRWARDTANMVTQHVQRNEAMRAAFKQIECRSATCRVDMIDDQKGEFSRQLPIFVNGLGATFPTADVGTVDNPDGTRTLSLYFLTNENAEPRGG